MVIIGGEWVDVNGPLGDDDRVTLPKAVMEARERAVAELSQMLEQATEASALDAEAHLTEKKRLQMEKPDDKNRIMGPCDNKEEKKMLEQATEASALDAEAHLTEKKRLQMEKPDDK